MSDVLDNERDPAPLWVVPLAIAAVVALVVALAWRWNGDADSAAPTVSFSAGPSPTAAALPSPVLAGSGCGGKIEQPLINGGPVPPNTGLRLLIGDRDLRSVDVDTGDVEVLATRTDARSFTVLAQTATQVLTVLRNPCSTEGFGNGLVARVDPVDGELTDLGRGDELLPGEPATVAQFDEDGAVRLRALGRRSTSRVPPGWRAYARTPTGYIASVIRNGFDAGVPPELGIGVPTSEKLTKSFGAGTVVAASPELLFWMAGGCPGRCLLTWTTVEGTNTAQPLDTNAWGGVVSPDGTKMAFRKVRASGRFGGHPGPPNEVALLELSGRGPPIRVLPGVVLPAKAGLTLTWSPDSQWLVIGADLGSGPAILLWREGMDRPARVGLPSTGGGTTGPPALLVLPR